MSQTAEDALASMSRAYERYYATGLYDQRYPRPNRRSLAHVLSLAGSAKRILDFGSGDGRYAIPLLHRTRAEIIAYDICPLALGTLAERTTNADERARLHLVQGPDDDYTAGKAIDLAIIMFGVLGHIPRRAERVATLARIRARLAGGAPGALILSVPNIHRRFFAEQKQFRNGQSGRGLAVEPGDILYSRHAGSETIDLFYHLYTPEGLAAELNDAGFEVVSMTSESLFPEAAVTQSGWVGGLDAILCAMLPSRLGYGIMATARGRG